MPNYAFFRYNFEGLLKLRPNIYHHFPPSGLDIKVINPVRRMALTSKSRQRNKSGPEDPLLFAKNLGKLFIVQS
jgi:hypothetical protein